MILECTFCEAIVDAQELYAYEDNDREGPPGKWTLLKCPSCTLPLLTSQIDISEGFDKPERVYPSATRQLGYSVPDAIRAAFDEAAVCYRSKAHVATAIMCRKALEGLCEAHGAKERNLSASLKKLKENGTIEARLF